MLKLSNLYAERDAHNRYQYYTYDMWYKLKETPQYSSCQVSYLVAQFI